MKLIIAIIQAYDSDRLLRAVTSAGLGATKIVSTGGFLRMANATILMGVDDERVQQCLEIIREHCEPRVESAIDPGEQEFIEWFPIGVHDVTVGGAVVFILPVRDYRRIFPAGHREEGQP
ncbi:MAG TPA: cyclic-di-AMP receptor [Thermomicrobiales bacterium]|nr:cyclic-di-AMP receptor [Thermomicrobiales bacterium]